MDFELSDERRMLAETASRFIANTYDIKTRHQVAETDAGFSAERWAQFAELGLIGALLPPDIGGFGGTGEDISVVFQELGRGLVVEPFLASGLLGASPIAIAGTDAQKAMLEDVIAGGHLLALAHGEPSGRYDISHVATKATREGDAWVLNGQKAVVLNGDTADTLIVSARIDGAVDDPRGLALFCVAADTVGITRRGYATVDGGRSAEISISNVRLGPDALIGDAGQAFPVLEQTFARAIVAVASEAIGIMDASKDMTLDYLKTRTQFGRPIGKFQVLQHRMVDMVLEIEQARSAVMLAANTLETGNRVTRERNVSAAKNLVGRVGRLVAEETIQMHGGIAMTWEYALPHFAKRLTMIDHQFGDTDHHLMRFAELGRT
ncbi:MAG: acyl-CoA dehydrogenase [Pseudomonadota bacterium]